METVSLIGMPGSGKSTVGVLLAKRLVRSFLDTDLLIQEAAGSSLQEYLHHHGYLALRELERQIVVGLDPGPAVIATGGSAVYSTDAISHLRSRGAIVYLHIGYQVMVARLGDYSQRGITMGPNDTLMDMFTEREPRYRRAATCTVDASLTPEEVCGQIEELLNA